MTVRIAPSILSADFAKLGDDIAMCVEGGADWIHVDVMDGCFVPNLTFGAKVIETVRRLTTLPIDVHLMVVEPEKYLEGFVAAGANVLTIHQEVSPHLHRQVQLIKKLGAKAGVAVNPATPIASLRDVARDLDLVLVMSVNPGFGGQRFIPRALDRIRETRDLLRVEGSQAVLEVDGGVTRDTITGCWRAGADTFVAGNAIFAAKDPRGEINALRQRCSEVA
ncbi:MAG: ribulose-phosphate 3-epimerase [Cytophagaceae bacterium]|nr:ribulose-phosphate 3-epimerase [Gemmatimonadaceae bacterium]